MPGGTMIVFSPSLYLRVSTSPDRKSTRLNSSHLGISYAAVSLHLSLHDALPIWGGSPANIHARSLKRPVRLLVGSTDEDPGSGFQFAHVTWNVGNDRNAGGNDDRLLSVLVLEGQHLARSEEHTSELQSLRHLVCRRQPPPFPTRRSSDLGRLPGQHSRAQLEASRPAACWQH